MAAQRRPNPHETGDAKMKAAAIKTVRASDKPAAVSSPAKQLQDQLQDHMRPQYQPLSKRMSVILISLLVAFAFVGGCVGGTGAIGFA